jgi:hypothetical protein
MVGLTAWDAVRRVSARGGALVVLGVLLTGACAGKSTGDDAESDLCPDVCTRGRHCANAPPLNLTCDDFCFSQDFVAENTGCHALYVESTRCSAKLSDVCTTDTAFRAELIAIYTCEHNYCSAHPGVDACIQVM